MRKILKKNEVAVFYYQGNHSHPVKRVVLITECNSKTITGYELREGFYVRDLAESPIKSFTRDNIAIVSELRHDNKLKRNKKNWNKSTLIRLNSIKALSLI